MTATSFFDTNVFLYVVSAAAEDAPKRAKATALIASCDFAISIQMFGVSPRMVTLCLPRSVFGQDSRMTWPWRYGYPGAVYHPPSPQATAGQV